MTDWVLGIGLKSCVSLWDAQCDHMHQRSKGYLIL